MQFSHHPDIWSRFPELSAAVLYAEGIRADVDVSAPLAHFSALARARLDAAGTESEFAEIQAWRRAFQKMGLKPTQYRCASESLLRRLRKEGELPRLHPLVDLCNAVSVAFAIPVAAIDTSRVAWPLQVRPARGDEHHEAFSGEIESPEPEEVSFVDAQGRAHARRWTHRQSGWSAVRAETRGVIIVAEALHACAREDTARLADALGAAIGAAFGASPMACLLTALDPVCERP